jgi:hypothetical protein
MALLAEQIGSLRFVTGAGNKEASRGRFDFNRSARIYDQVGANAAFIAYFHR